MIKRCDFDINFPRLNSPSSLIKKGNVSKLYPNFYNNSFARKNNILNSEDIYKSNNKQYSLSFKSNILEEKLKVQAEQAKKKKYIKYLTLAGIIAVSAGIIFLLTKKGLPKLKSLSAKKGSSINQMSQSAAASQAKGCSSDKIKQIFSEGDCAYRNRIAQGAGLLPEEAYKLNSIAGIDEFVERTSELALNPEIYSPGGKIFNPNGSIKAFDNKNIENLIFGANFHIHTQNSDGALTVEKLLNDSAKYADKYFEKNKKPFFIAITDHDSVQGCIEAVNIIKNNPEKYKNLKLVLGIENTTKIKNSPFLYQEGEAHVLSYCINPFSDDIQNFLIKRVQTNKQNVINVLNNANEKFNGIINQYDFKYDIDDMSNIAPMIKGSVKNASYYIKDYLQFKLIYSFAVSRNSQLLDVLKEKGININNIDYSTFIKYIPKNLDYSRGQKYFDYYLTALREYFEKQLSCDKAEINRLIPQIPSSLKSVLQEIENLTLTPNSPLYAPNNEFPLFEDCISALAKFKDGAISMAHPGVLFPYKALKSNEDTVKLYEKLYEIFNLKGKPKKLFSEDFYGSYYNNNESLYKKLHEISEKYSLLKTGGLDTHSTNIFSV